MPTRYKILAQPKKVKVELDNRPSSKRAITKPPVKSQVTSTARSRRKVTSKSFSRPVGRPPIKNTRSTKGSSLGRVTRRSPIGGVSVRTTGRR